MWKKGKVSRVIRLERMEDSRSVSHPRPILSGLDFILHSSISQSMFCSLGSPKMYSVLWECVQWLCKEPQSSDYAADVLTCQERELQHAAAPQVYPASESKSSQNFVGPAVQKHQFKRSWCEGQFYAKIWNRKWKRMRVTLKKQNLA